MTDRPPLKTLPRFGHQYARPGARAGAAPKIELLAAAPVDRKAQPMSDSLTVLRDRLLALRADSASRAQFCRAAATWIWESVMQKMPIRGSKRSGIYHFAELKIDRC